MRQRTLLTIGVLLLAVAVIGGGVVAGRASWTSGAAGAATSGYGPGMMGGVQDGMMGGVQDGMMGGVQDGMMGGTRLHAPAGPTISIDQAEQAVSGYLTRSGGSSLGLDEVMEFQDNFYAIVKDRSSGTGAFELLVDRVSGAVAPEPGPNMMWNTRYGMMGGVQGGMMGSGGGSGPMTVSKDRAAQVAQGWLDVNQKGALAEEPDVLPGYYTVHFK